MGIDIIVFGGGIIWSEVTKEELFYAIDLGDKEYDYRQG